MEGVTWDGEGRLVETARSIARAAIRPERIPGPIGCIYGLHLMSSWRKVRRARAAQYIGTCLRCTIAETGVPRV
jgi:hypothetical protein